MLLVVLIVLLILFILIKSNRVEKFKDVIDDKIYIKKTLFYNLIWYNKKKNYSIWEPESIDNYYPLGHVISLGTKKPKKESILVKIKNPDSKPKNYNLITVINTSNNKISVWKPITNTGYMYMGNLFQIGMNKPSIHKIRCIPEYTLKESSLVSITVKELQKFGGYKIWDILNSNYFIVNDIANSSEPKDKIFQLRDKFLNIENKIEAKKSKRYKFIWKGYNHQTNKTISIWRPVQLGNFVSLGDIIVNSNTNPNGIIETILLDKRIVKPAQSFGVKPIANFINSDKKMINFWKPVPPKGYGYLGHIAQLGNDEPKDINVINCVPLEILNKCTSCNGKELFWNSTQLSSQKLSLWVNKYNLFFVNNDYKKPKDFDYNINEDFIIFKSDPIDTQRNITLTYELNSRNTEVYDDDKRYDLYRQGLASLLGIRNSRLRELKFKNKTVNINIYPKIKDSEEPTSNNIIYNISKQIENDTLTINNSNNDGYISKIIQIDQPLKTRIINDIPIDNTDFLQNINSK